MVRTSGLLSFGEFFFVGLFDGLCGVLKIVFSFRWSPADVFGRTVAGRILAAQESEP